MPIATKCELGAEGQVVYAVRVSALPSQQRRRRPRGKISLRLRGPVAPAPRTTTCSGRIAPDPADVAAEHHAFSCRSTNNSAAFAWSLRNNSHAESPARRQAAIFEQRLVEPTITVSSLLAMAQVSRVNRVFGRHRAGSRAPGAALVEPTALSGSPPGGLFVPKPCYEANCQRCRLSEPGSERPSTSAGVRRWRVTVVTALGLLGPCTCRATLLVVQRPMAIFPAAQQWAFCGETATSPQHGRNDTLT